MAQTEALGLVLPDSDPGRPGSSLRDSSAPPPDLDEVEDQLKARATYARGALGGDEDASRVEDGDAVRVGARTASGNAPSSPADSDADAADKGFTYSWQRALAQIDAVSDDDMPAANDENARPVPPPRRTYARKPLDEIRLFGGSSDLPDVTSSSDAGEPMSRRGSSVALRVREGREPEESSPMSEDPSRLFDDAEEEEEGGTPGTSPVKPLEEERAGTPLFLPEGEKEEERARSISEGPRPKGREKLRELALQRAAKRSATPDAGVDAVLQEEPAEDAQEEPRKPDSKGKRARSRSRRVSGDLSGADGEGEGQKRKKPKKLTKKELEETHRETARLLAQQNATIPRWEKRMRISELMEKFQATAAVSQPQPEENPAQALRKLPRPSKPNAVPTIAPHHPSLPDDPIVDASSSPSVSRPAQPSSAAPSSQAPALPVPPAAPARFVPPLDDSDDELPESVEAYLAQEDARERARKEAAQKRDEEEKRRLVKVKILEERKKRTMVTAKEMLKGTGEESDSDIEIEGEGKGSARKGRKRGSFMEKLVASTSRAVPRAPRPPLVPTDSQLVRASRPTFDSSSPPSARKLQAQFVSRDALNRKLLKKAEERAEEEVKRKEEEWVRRGGRRRERDWKAGEGVELGEVLRRAVESAKREEEEDGEEEEEGEGDGEYVPDAEGGVDSDAAMDEDDFPPTEVDENLPPAADVDTSPSPSQTDSNKENEAGENKENEAPTAADPALRTVLREMKIDSSTEGGAESDDEEEEPFRPRKKRRLANGQPLVLIGDDDEDEDAEGEEDVPVAVARRLFQDSEEDGEESAPAVILGGAALGAAFEDEAMDVFGAAGGLGGEGGLSQFFAESQTGGALTQLRNAAKDELTALSPTKLMPSIRLSTQQRNLQDEVFAEDQEARLLDAVRAVNEKNRETSVSGHEDRLELSPSFLAEEFTQRMDQDTSSEFHFDVGDTKSVADMSVADMSMDAESVSELPMDMDEEPSSPVDAGRLRRLRRHESPAPSSVHESDSEPEHESSPAPVEREPTPVVLNAFDILKMAQAREERRQEKKAVRSAFVEGEAEEEEDDPLLGFGVGRQDDDDEDGEDDGILEELVNDQTMDNKTLAAEKVLEKHLEQQAEDDAVVEKLHMDAVQGKLRQRKRGDDFFSDSDDDDDRRRYLPPMPGKRKDGADDLEALARNPATLGFYRAYESTHTPVEDHLFDHLLPPAEGEEEVEDDTENPRDRDDPGSQEDDDEEGSERHDEDEDENDDEENELQLPKPEDAPRPQVVGVRQLQQELREAAKHKDSIVTFDTEDVSWVDRGDSDDEREPKYKVVEAIRRAKPVDAGPIDELMVITGPSRTIGIRDKAKLQKFAKEDSNNFSKLSSRGAVTGFAKPTTKQAAQKAGGGKSEKAPSQRPAAHGIFSRKRAE